MGVSAQKDLPENHQDLRNRTSVRQGGGFFARWFTRIAALGLLVTVIIPVFWVLAYGVLDAPGTFLMARRAAQGMDISHQPIKLARMSPHLVRAVIAAEDARFCIHDGFDREAIEKAMDYNERQARRGSEKRRGASTISQQTAKNLFLWPDRSYVRKALEVYFTLLIETMWSKERIMESYLNVAEFGDGAFGVEAAAQLRFKKSAQDLSAAEAARLAAILPSPNKWKINGRYVSRRSSAIVARMGAVKSNRLDACVFGNRFVPEPSQKKGKPSAPLPDLPPPPPELAPIEEGAPIDLVPETTSAPITSDPELPLPAEPPVEPQAPSDPLRDQTVEPTPPPG
jgi:monofunctional biosynthetic peptidoglycan transglycosylase